MKQRDDPPDRTAGHEPRPERRKKTVPARPRIGWREWVALPDLGIPAIKAKVDTGARTSALHAIEVETFRRRGQSMVRFKVHPLQRDSKTTVQCEAVLLERRRVRSSSGQSDERLVIVTPIEILGERWPVEITLARRDTMGFRMLLGRQALGRRFLVDPSRSYHGGRPAPGKGAARRRTP